MSRRPRQYLPGMPYQVRQRGNNREACFYGVDDYYQYLDLLSIMLKRYEVRLHAYVLMTNHVHLIMTPSDKEGISQVSKVVGSRFAYHMNRSYNRTGTMWKGRHKASVIDSQAYLLTCYRYVELNPVAAHMVSTPEEYQWSSYGANAWSDKNLLVTPHDIYLGLSSCEKQRLECYRNLFQEKISDENLQTILTQGAIVNQRVMNPLEKRLNIRWEKSWGNLSVAGHEK